MACFAITVSIVFAVWVVAKRDTRVVKGSQPGFLFLICIGSAIMTSSIFPLGMDDEWFDKIGEDCPECNIACGSWPWLLFVGFTVLFSAIFSKLWRLNKFIAKAKKKSSAKNIRVDASDVLPPFFALLSLNVVVLTVWTVVDPLVFRRESDGEFSSFGTCRPEKGTPALAFGSLLGCINVGALLLAEIEAYKARNLSDHLSESKYIGLATVSMFQMIVVGVPVLFLVQDQPDASFFVFSCIIFMINVSILALIFLPKVYFDRHPPPKASLKTTGSGLQVKLPKYNSQFHASHDWADDGSEGDEETETRREVERLRNAIEVYRFNFRALKKEIEEKGLMDVTAFIASLEGQNREQGLISSMIERSSSVEERLKPASKDQFWTVSGFDIFSELVSSEARSSQPDQGPGEGVSMKNSNSEPATRGSRDIGARKRGWGTSGFELFSEAEAPESESKDPEKGKLPSVEEASDSNDQKNNA